MRIISLVALNPMNVISTNLYLLKEFANKHKEISEEFDIRLHYFDSLIPDQSNAIDLIVRRILDSDCEVIGFSTYCWNIETVLQCTKMVKSIKPEITIFFGGPEATGNSFELILNYKIIDFIIAGEGEIAFKEYLEYLLGKLKKEEVANLVYLQNDQIRYNHEKIIANLDEIPPLFSSGAINVDAIGTHLYSFETVRGCSYQCSYCYHHKGCHEIRGYSLERVYNELGALLKSKKLKYIWIIDPCFNDNEERSIKIIRYIVNNNINNIEFGFEIRNETMSETFIREMSKLQNIKFVAMGLQTIQEKALRAVHRELDKQKFEENIELIKKYFSKDVDVHVDLIFGLPENNLEDYKNSINYVLGLGCMIFTQPLKILHGTELAKEINKYGLVVNEKPPYEVLYNVTFSYDDMIEAKKINAMLNLFQSTSAIRNIFEQIHQKFCISYADLLQRYGDYFWSLGDDFLFTNYISVEMKDLAEMLQDATEYLFGVKNKEGNFDNTMIQLDWGSVAKQQKYSLE